MIDPPRIVLVDPPRIVLVSTSGTTASLPWWLFLAESSPLYIVPYFPEASVCQLKRSWDSGSGTEGGAAVNVGGHMSF